MYILHLINIYKSNLKKMKMKMMKYMNKYEYIFKYFNIQYFQKLIYIVLIWILIYFIFQC